MLRELYGFAHGIFEKMDGGVVGRQGGFGPGGSTRRMKGFRIEINATDRQINTLVYELYELTEKEIYCC